MYSVIRQWLRACHECGSKKSWPKLFIAAPRSLRQSDVGDRWTMDVPGGLPMTKKGNPYAVAFC